MIRDSWLVIRMALLALLMAMVNVAHAADERPPPQPGGPMPAFALFDLEGKLHRLSDYQEPVLVINFLAYWCDTWVAQLPQLRQLAHQQRDLNFRLICVSIDGQWTDVRRKYLRDQKLPFPVLLDGRETLAKQLQLRHVPTVFVVNRERKVTYVHEAYPGNPPVLQAIRKALSNGWAGY